MEAFVKFTNNDGMICEDDTTLWKKAQAFSHLKVRIYLI